MISNTIFLLMERQPFLSLRLTPHCFFVSLPKVPRGERGRRKNRRRTRFLPFLPFVPSHPLFKCDRSRKPRASDDDDNSSVALLYLFLACLTTFSSFAFSLGFSESELIVLLLLLFLLSCSIRGLEEREGRKGDINFEDLFRRFTFFSSLLPGLLDSKVSQACEEEREVS